MNAPLNEIIPPIYAGHEASLRGKEPFLLEEHVRGAIQLTADELSLDRETVSGTMLRHWVMRG